MNPVLTITMLNALLLLIAISALASFVAHVNATYAERRRWVHAAADSLSEADGATMDVDGIAYVVLRLGDDAQADMLLRQGIHVVPQGSRWPLDVDDRMSPPPGPPRFSSEFVVGGQLYGEIAGKTDDQIMARMSGLGVSAAMVSQHTGIPVQQVAEHIESPRLYAGADFITEPLLRVRHDDMRRAMESSKGGNVIRAFEDYNRDAVLGTPGVLLDEGDNPRILTDRLTEGDVQRVTDEWQDWQASKAVVAGGSEPLR